MRERGTVAQKPLQALAPVSPQLTFMPLLMKVTRCPRLPPIRA